jgi:hypothetical protein
MRTLFTLAAATLAALTAQGAVAARYDPDAALQKALAGYVAGTPVDCISLPNTTGSSIVTGRAIIYRIGTRLYVNETRGGAKQLHRDDIIVTRTFGTQLCRQDVIRLVDRTSQIPHGFVSLGQFVPYTKLKTR